MKAFRDWNTGELRENLINGFHLKDIGIRTLCKAVRKSLYSPNNISNDTLAHIVQISDMAEQREAQRQAREAQKDEQNQVQSGVHRQAEAETQQVA